MMNNFYESCLCSTFYNTSGFNTTSTFIVTNKQCSAGENVLNNPFIIIIFKLVSAKNY